MFSKSRAELDKEATAIISGRDMVKVKNLMLRKFRVDAFNRLTNDQIEEFIEILKDAVYKGMV